MEKLFAIFIGGEIAGATLELHDMRFVVAEVIEDTYPALRETWWGTPKSLHLDCWLELSQADGYTIDISDQPFTGPEKLYFIHIGGYDPAQFTELHRNLFLVATDERTAMRRALDQARDFQMRHKDTFYEVDRVICLNTLEAPRRYLHLQPAAAAVLSDYHCKYVPIGRTG